MKRRISIFLAVASMLVLANTMASAARPDLVAIRCSPRKVGFHKFTIGPNSVTATFRGSAGANVSASDPAGNRTMVWDNLAMSGDIPTLGFAQYSFNTSAASTGTVTIPSGAPSNYPATNTNRFFIKVNVNGMTLVSDSAVVLVGTVYDVPPLAGTVFTHSNPVAFYQQGDPGRVTVMTLTSSTVTIEPEGHTFGDKDFGMNGSQEVPTNGSTATAFGTIDVDTLNNKLHFDITHNVANETAAHIHGPAARGVNAGVIFGLPAGAHKVGTWDYPQSQEANILSGQMYVNIHSVAFPGGEIRGQIEPTQAQNAVPSMTEWGIVLLAGLLLILSVFYLRRRRLGADGPR